MIRGRTPTWIILPAIVAAGCSAPVQIQPGLSAIRIEVRAEPKQGYTKPPMQISGGDGVYDMEPEESHEVGPFRRVDYRTLNDIVVWIEPHFDIVRPEPAGDGPPVIIKFGAPSTQRLDVPLFVIGVGGRLEFVNRSGRDDVIYSLSEANSFDTGVVSRNGLASYQPKSSGLINVLCESRDEPIALVYVAPTRWVERARSGSKVVFTDLPPGAYHVGCWQRRLPGSHTDVTTIADRIAQVVVSVSVNTLPKVD